jgi:hypothetical protein
MYIFTDFVPDPETRYKMGFVLSAVVSFCIVVNLAYLNSEIPRKAYNLLKRRYLKFKNAGEKVKLKALETLKEARSLKEPELQPSPPKLPVI